MYEFRKDTIQPIIQEKYEEINSFFIMVVIITQIEKDSSFKNNKNYKVLRRSNK